MFNRPQIDYNIKAVQILANKKKTAKNAKNEENKK